MSLVFLNVTNRRSQSWTERPGPCLQAAKTAKPSLVCASKSRRAKRFDARGRPTQSASSRERDITHSTSAYVVTQQGKESYRPLDYQARSGAIPRGKAARRAYRVEKESSMVVCLGMLNCGCTIGIKAVCV